MGRAFFEVMPILCGTDFSPSSQRACRVAAQLARRFGDSIVLAHGRTGIRQALLGSVAEEVRSASTPVILVPRPWH
jgi:nucleotide-binding universal stress UspA family protein